MIELGFNYRNKIDHLLFCCTEYRVHIFYMVKKDTIVEYKFTKAKAIYTFTYSPSIYI